jgi:hypothetical protein
MSMYCRNERKHDNDRVQGPDEARTFSGQFMIGVGITMEGINQNEIMYEFALEQSWRSPLNETDLSHW